MGFKTRAVANLQTTAKGTVGGGVGGMPPISLEARCHGDEVFLGTAVGR